MTESWDNFCVAGHNNYICYFGKQAQQKLHTHTQPQHQQQQHQLCNEAKNHKQKKKRTNNNKKNSFRNQAKKQTQRENSFQRKLNKFWQAEKVSEVEGEGRDEGERCGRELWPLRCYGK